MICELCPQKCGAKREEKQGNGICKEGTLPKVARIAPHYFEEPCISGEKGTGAVFFSGCSLCCIYCQNYDISQKNKGEYITPEELADYYKKFEESGVHSIELVSASHFADAVIKSLNIYKPNIPVIYNSSGYESVDTLKRFEGLVDVYLPDFKYADNALSQELSKCNNYKETAIEAIKEMVRQVGKVQLDESGMIQKGVIVRHLVLPNHTRNSIDVLNILKKNFNDSIKVSLMGQYIPCGEATGNEKLGRKITKREYEKVLNHLFSLGLDGFAQELSSADEKYIPKWNFNNE
ncbi:MAG: radical SAM protein [Oscillospiraceae bacterium]|nr:radical SAM protein [Candidatus Ruminococcus equi]